MRLIEERSSVGIQLFILLLIVLSGIVIQICDGRIAHHSDSILRQMIHANRKQSEKINQNLSNVRYSVFALGGADIRMSDHQDKVVLEHEEFGAIIQQYRNGQLSDREYYNKMAAAHRRQRDRIGAKYEQILLALGEMIKEGTEWTSVKRIVLVVQVSAIVLAAWLYYSLLRSIDKRIKKKSS